MVRERLKLGRSDKDVPRFARAVSVLTAGLLMFLGLGTSATMAAAALTIGYIPVVGSAQLFVIDGEGWAKADGIDLKLTRFDSGPAMLQALASGQLDLYLGGIGPVMVARGQGIDVRVDAAAAIDELAVVVRGPFADAISKGPDLASAVTAFSQAQHRKPKLSTQPPGSVPDTVLRYWLDVGSHLSFSDLDILSMGIDATQQAFLSGAVDGAIVREPTLTLLRDRDSRVTIVAAGGQLFPNQPGSVLAVYKGNDPAKRDAVDRLIKLHIRATELLNKDPKSAAPFVTKALGAGIVPVSVMERALVSPISHFIADPAVIVEASQKMEDYQLKLGVISKVVPVDQVFDLERFKRLQ